MEQINAVSTHWTWHGASAYDDLRSTIAAIKRDDPLRPVTVLVPSQLCGVAVRRALAHGVGGRPGVAVLSVLTVDRLAEQLAAPDLVGQARRPTTNAVLAAAWRSALAVHPGVFAPVATHPATVRALVRAHRELREVDDEGLAAIGSSGGPVATELLRLHRTVTRLLEDDWYDVTDLRRTAAAILHARPARVAEVGSSVLFLPQDLPPDALRLVQELSDAADVTVIAALTGDARIDAEAQRALSPLTPQGWPTEPLPERQITIAHASDSDDEARCAIRTLVSTLQDTPAHRVAVLYGSARPYARLIAEHLDAAKVAWTGTSTRPTIERTLPRALLDLLALPDHDWRRDEVLAVLAAAPIQGPHGRVPAARWDRLSRAAGVVAGDEWDTRLKGYAAHLRTAAEAERLVDEPREWLINQRERDAAAATELRDFVVGLRRRLDVGASLHDWSELSRWSLDTFAALAGDLDEGGWLPEEEARAARAVTRSLAHLAGLATIEPTADLTALRLTVDLDLADDLPRHGRYGTGVVVGPLSAAIGLDVDAVFVVGVAEDLVPGRAMADALLPDRIRALTDGQLPDSRERTSRIHRQLLAAIAAAPRCVVSFPRGDLRRSSIRLPSRWLVPFLRRAADDDSIQASGWQAVSGLDESPSFAASLSAAETLATAQDWRTRASVAAHSRGGAVTDALPSDDVVAKAIAMRRGRADAALTRFDGDLSGADLPDLTTDRVFSPTALERWATCPHGYFVGSLLSIAPVVTPEDLIQVPRLEVGNLIHVVLDRFFQEQLAMGAVPGGTTEWSQQQRQRLRELAERVGDEFVGRGVTGHPVLWRQERIRILADLDRFLDEDNRIRAASGRRQERSELLFGVGGAPPVDVRLPDGRVLRFRGSADRVDRAGASIAVVDYKTGRSGDFDRISENDPTVGGTKLQLPIYGYAARAAFNTPDAPVSAEYWFLRKDRGKTVTLEITAPVEEEYSRVLGILADGIAGGMFPHRPPAEDGYGSYVRCGYCDPDRLGAGEHRERWARKRHDPRLADYLCLVEPDTEAGEA